MFLRRLSAAVTTIGIACMPAATVCAGVVVLANRTTARVDFTIIRADGARQQHRLAARDVLSIPATAAIGVSFDAGGTARQYLLRASSVQFFVSTASKLDLIQIALSGPQDRPPDKDRSPGRAGDAAPQGSSPAPAADPVCTVPVMLLVDQHEPAARSVWENRLRERLQEASDIFAHCCRVRFEAVAIETWTTDDTLVDFDRSLRDFERKVRVSPAAVAIGFTSRYQHTVGQTHLGGTRGAFHPYILLREWSSRVAKAERLEMLVHELGHYLGAVHSAELDSVMRPSLGDHRANARDFRIGFDPLNTFAICLVADELRTRRPAGLSQFRPATKDYLRGVYQALAEALPKDPAAPQYLDLLERRTFVQPEPMHHSQSLVEATQTVVRAITAAAAENSRLPNAPAAAGSAVRLAGDRLGEFYVRRAAVAARSLPADRSAQAFLLGLGIAMDHSTALRETPLSSELCRRAEPEPQRRQRLAVLGAPTMHGRADLSEHFAVSAAMTVLAGTQAAESAAIARELTYSQLGHGFSFAELSADVAGTTFAAEVLAGRLPLAKVGAAFSVKDFLPEPQNLREEIPWMDFLQTYGSAEDDRFYAQKQAVRRRVLALPGYRRP